MSFIYLPFSYIMKGCVWIAQNSYLFGLLFYALVFQVLLFPLAIKQQKSQVKMGKIRPKEMAIRNKYSGRTDRVTQQRMNQEIQEMHQQEGYSPLSGCLPLLIQLPLIMILYAIVRYPIQYSSHFDDISKANVTQTVVAEHTDYTADDSFDKLLIQYTFDYAEDLRSHLVKDNPAATEANTLLTEKIKQLGSVSEAEGEDAKYANGFSKLTLKKGSNSGYSELITADLLANYGKDYVEQLQKDGALDSEYSITKYPLTYTDNGAEIRYADKMPNFSFAGINLLMIPSFNRLNSFSDWMLLLIPILVFATSFLNAKLSRKFQPQVGPNGQEAGGGLFMMVGMPLMSAVFTLVFPAALGVYWVWRTLLSIPQPIILNKMYPIPAVTQEEIDEATRQMKGSNKKKKVITIEVDEDDDSYSDIEVKGSDRVQPARPKADNGNKTRADLPYRQPTKIEMLSADDPEETKTEE